MPNRLAMKIVASALLLSCVDQPMISGVGSFQLAATGADLSAGTATVQVSVTPEFGFSSPVVVTLTGAPSGLTADPLTVAAGATRGTLTLHAQSGVVLDQMVTVTGTAGDQVLAAPIWVTSGFDGGSLDASFGDNGIAEIAANGACGGLALQGDGAILVGIYGGSVAAGGIARATADGRLDATFGQNGTAALAGTVGGPHQITVGDGGSILAVGDDTASARTRGRVWKVDAHGAADASFGTGGFAQPIVTGTFSLWLSGGKTYLLGSTGGSFGFMAIMNPDGSLDASIGPSGLVQGLFFGKAAALADGSGWLVTGQKGVFSDASLRGGLAVLSLDGDEEPVLDDPGDVMSAYSSPLGGPTGMFAVYTQFTASGAPTGFVQKLRPDLSADPSFVSSADLDSVIQLIAAGADGKLLLVKTPGSQLLEHVVRLNADGTSDPTVRIAMGKLAGARLPIGARLTCGPVLDAQGRLVFGYEGFPKTATGGISLVRVHL